MRCLTPCWQKKLTQAVAEPGITEQLLLDLPFVFKKLEKVHGLKAVEIIKDMPPGQSKDTII